MPTLRPVLIKTKGLSFWLGIWRWITSVRQWEVVSNWHHILPDGTTIIIPAGFVFDGASIPRILWGILSPTGLLFVPSLIHDFGYRYDYLWGLDDTGMFYRYKKGVGRHEWDGLFKKVGFEVNGMRLVETIAYLMLVLFGKSAWLENRERNSPEIIPRKVEHFARKVHF